MSDSAKQYLTEAQATAAIVPNIKPDTELRALRRIGVIGSGTMGAGIAICFSMAGYPVLLVDIDRDALERGMAAIKKTCNSLAQRGRTDIETSLSAIERIEGSLSLEDVSNCDLVIEAAFESMEIKRDLASQLGRICRPGAIIATNTSTLDVDVLGEASGRPLDFLGMHFFSPAHAMKLLEVVRGKKTSDEVLATVMKLAPQIGKIAVVSGVCFGFIGNRMLEGYLRETEALLVEGATPNEIDSAIESVGFAMGPCKMIDMAGVDVAAKVVIERRKSSDSLIDPAYRTVIQRLYERGRFGQKTQKGYYRYEGREAKEDPEFKNICCDLARENHVRQRSDISATEIIERCLFPLINEGARIVEEKIALRASDVDVVWVFGYGFPASLGGPMFWADQIGAQHVVAGMEKWESEFGNKYGYWSVSPLLRHSAEANTPLYKSGS